MGASKSLFWAVCIVCICGSRGYCGGVVASSLSFRHLSSKGESSIKFKRNEYERIIEIARKEIGVVERTGKNDGARVAQYLGYCDIESPAPYCAAWVSWCFGQAGYSQPRTAWSPALFPASRLVKEPLPGIVYGLYYTSLGRIGHCGLVEIVKNDWVYGVEANTNFEGSREGQGVYRKIRHKRTIHAYADWIK